MDTNTANENTPRTLRTNSQATRAAKPAKAIQASRPATKKEVILVRQWLLWFRENQWSFSMLEHDLGKSGGWCHKVINDNDRYEVTTIDVAVIRASYRSAFRLHGREQHKYQLMQSIIVKAGSIMRDVENLASEA